MKKFICVMLVLFMVVVSVAVSAQQSVPKAASPYEVGAEVKAKSFGAGDDLIGVGAAVLGTKNGVVAGSAVAADSKLSFTQYPMAKLNIDCAISGEVTFNHYSSSSNNDQNTALMYYIELPKGVDTSFGACFDFYVKAEKKHDYTFTKVEPKEGEPADSVVSYIAENQTSDLVYLVKAKAAKVAYLLPYGGKSWTAAPVVDGKVDLPVGFVGFVRYDYGDLAYDKSEVPTLNHTCTIDDCVNSKPSYTDTSALVDHICEIESDLYYTHLSFTGLTKDKDVYISAPLGLDAVSNNTSLKYAYIGGSNTPVDLYDSSVKVPANSDGKYAANIMRIRVEDFNCDYFKVDSVKNNNFDLYLNTTPTVSQSFAVLDKKSGKLWDSNPRCDDYYNASIMGNGNKLETLITISFLKSDRTDGIFISGKNFTFKFNECMLDGKCQGLIVTYNYGAQVLDMTIPVALVITDKGLKAEVLFDRVKESETNGTQLSSVEFLPAFGAATCNDDGYLFIPDGSGAIVEHKKMASAFKDYSEQIYGADSSVDLTMRKVAQGEGIKMPVYGSKVNDAAYCAIITSGDKSAKINATSSSAAYNLASVWPTFYYREYDLVGIVSKDKLSRPIRLLDPNPSTENPTIEYHFLSGEDANYSGMARCYRDHLINEYQLGKLQAQDVAPVIQAFGVTESDDVFFGVPIKKALTATSLEDVTSWHNTLKEKGVNTAKYFLYGFQTGGYMNDYVRKFGVNGKVGGKKDLESLIAVAGKGNVYMGFDLLHDYNYGGILSDKNYVAALNKITIVKENGLASTGAWKGTISWKLASLNNLSKSGKKLVDSLNSDLGCGLVFENMGSELYNDFDEKYHADRLGYSNEYVNINNSASAKGINVGVDGANVYMIGNDGRIMNEVPTSSSNHKLFTKNVPFYQIALHGYVNLSSKPLNSYSDLVDAVNYCAQFGMMPTYRVTAVDSKELKNSGLNFLYNTGFTHWEKKIVADYKLINSVSAGLSNQAIFSHEFTDDGLSIVRYENGVEIVYNQGNETVSYGGNEIAPMTVKRIG